MKKIISLVLCLLLLSSLALPVLADSPRVTFTADSLPEVGGTLTVNKEALLSDGSITSDMYNALLEGNVLYSWYKNGMVTMEGTANAGSNAYKLTLADQGCSIYVKLTFFSDGSFRDEQKCGEAVSGTLSITAPAPKVNTTSLPAAIVGKAYYVRLDCTDPDAVFSEFMGSQLSEFGMYLTQHGEIEGTPTKAGNCHVNIHVAGAEGGEDSVSFDITVSAAPPAPEVSITTKSLPEATVGEKYQAKLSCTDSKATFSVSYNPGKANDFDKTGLTLSKDGTISGTPAKAGSFGFCVCAAGEGGEDYMVYTLVVKAAPEETTASTETTQAPTEATTAATEATTQQTTEVTKPTEEAPSEPVITVGADKAAKSTLPWWAILLIGLAAAGAGVAVAIVLVKKKV